MDQLLSQLIPTNRIGNDGFNWWVGQVEGTAQDEVNNKGGYRFKVRIVGEHPGDPEILSTADLPWATVVMPVTVPFMPGNVGGGHPQLQVGCWVIGFYIDNDRQKPIIMGSIGQVPGATKTFVERTPDTKPFVTAIPQLNAQADGNPKQKDTEKNTATGGLYDGTKDGDGNARVSPPARKVAPLKARTAQAEDWCQSKAEKCDKDDITGKMSTIMAEFMAAVQNSGGNVGTYYVNQATGAINEAVGTARNYVNKAMSVVTEFTARVKGFIIEKLTNGVKDLIQSLLYPSEEGNALTPVTEFFNNLLKNLGCQMADLGDRLAQFITDILMSYVNQIYQAVACQIDALVNGIMSKINELMNSILGDILGPLQDILGAIAQPLNILGGAINFVMNLLGITCSGPDRECSKYKLVCTDGGDEEDDDDKDFLDDLLDSIDNLFPATGADYTQYVCEDAYEGSALKGTTIGFTGGIPAGGTTTGLLPGGEITVPDEDDPDNPDATINSIITYTIDDVDVTEGDIAIFTIQRAGRTDISSSVKVKTLKYQGSADEGPDYLAFNDIIGFAPNETSKQIFIRTFYDQIKEQDETFYVRMDKNSPSSGSGVKTSFIKQISRCTITEKITNEPYDPYGLQPVNPIEGISEIGENDPTIGGDTDDGTTEEVPETNPPYDDTGIGDEFAQPKYSVTPDKAVCPEGEFIVYTIETQNVSNGTILYWTLSGQGITSSDIVGGLMNSSVVINNDTAKVTVGIEDDSKVEDAEVLRFTLNGTGAVADVLITSENDLDDFDGSEGETEENASKDFEKPTVDPDEVITDENGGIINIPVTKPGDPYAEPPYVAIGGEGSGAVATALLDNKGFVTEIRVKSPGFGYKINTPTAKGLRCIIDTFTLARPGIGYTEKPTIYVDGRTDVAEAIINEDGFVIGARVLDRVTTWNKVPKVIIVGGNGFGAKLIPSLSCLDTTALTTIGSTKIGTGRYVDCP